MSGGGLGVSNIVRVPTQEDVYGVYRDLGLHGATVVHVNRHFNLVPYLPGGDAKPVPYPIPMRELREYYEQGLDSHRWLFVAAQTGFVRRVVTVLPEGVFRKRREHFRNESAFSVTGDRVEGYSYDLPRTVVSLAALPWIDEPVVVNLDAGYFVEDADPVVVARTLRERLPDLRLVVLIDSTDEPDVDDGMRGALDAFAAEWRRR